MKSIFNLQTFLLSNEQRNIRLNVLRGRRIQYNQPGLNVCNQITCFLTNFLSPITFVALLLCVHMYTYTKKK